VNKNIEIIQPDDWHVHFREGDMLEMVTNFSSRINNRCVAMPNTEIPITDTNKASAYKKLLNKASQANGRKETVSYLNRAAKIKSKIYSTSKVSCFRCNGAGFLRISLDETKTCLSCYGKGFLVQEMQQL